MNIEAFNNYSLEDTMFLYLATRVPLIGNKISNFLGQRLISYNGSHATYKVHDEMLENYFQQLDTQKRSENINNENVFVSPYKALAKKLIDIYPNGIKQGTVKYWRGNIFEICRKLEALSTIATLDTGECIKATQTYVDSFNGDFQYMRTLPYFILKTTLVDGQYEYTSDLLTMIEYIRNPNDTEIPIHTDWIADLK